MTSFIEKLANFIKNENYDLHHLTIILPSQRAKKYLQQALYKAYGKAFFSPKMITMNQWIKACNPLPVIEPSRALFELYYTHQACNKAEDFGMDEFLKWGKTLLSDFDEIDRYLIDAKQLFKNLTEIKEIENWSFNNDELTPAQKRFLEFWSVLPEYYTHFNEKLKKDGVCYMGGAYKHISNHIDLIFQEDQSMQFIFAGFNAMSKAELNIIKQLYKMGRAKVFIDADTYYLNNKMHEAGSFLRQLQETLETKNLDFVIDQLSTDTKNIKIYNCVESTGQSKISASLLHDEIPTDKQSSTLLLLADESLIIPVIKNLPKTIEKANITLGLPLKNTALRTWIDLMFRFQENAKKYKSTSIYYKDFIQFIKHPFIHDAIPGHDKEILLKLERDIITKNILFINFNKIKLSTSSKQLFVLYFQHWKDDFISALQCIRELNQLLFQNLDKNEAELEKTIISEFDQQMATFQNLMLAYKPKIQLNTFKNLLNQHWFNSTVAYYGNPLDGLQIMGLLESRLLDFENIIVVGLNNMKMPPGNPIQTIIPMDLRRYHGLPTPREKQGLFAHHFYRLLHQAKNIWITYSTAEGRQGIEEPSQYIHQIKLELARKNNNIKLQEFDYTIENRLNQQKPNKIEKTEHIIKRLDEYFAKGTSVSALNTYLRCPMDFYYQYILGFGEEKQVEEEIEAGSLGSIIHETLEELYQPFLPQEGSKVRKAVKVDDINLMTNRYQKILNIVFQRYYEDENLEQVKLGKNYLSLKMAEHLISSFLKKEKAFLSEKADHLYIVSLEEKLETTIECNINGSVKKVKIKGVIDRVDRVDGSLRIIDYKSGKCDKNKVTLKDHKTKDDQTMLIEQIKKVDNFLLQLITYLKLYKDEHAEVAAEAGIISLVDLKNSPFLLKSESGLNNNELILFYKKIIESILEDIYNPDIPFEHKHNSKYCSFC
jgi:hypothetical protein